nr:hypothetical protein B0A51_02862 [Rachicladosporium sp. CCFEE 5018]
MLSLNIASLAATLTVLRLTSAACVLTNKLEDVEDLKAQGVPDSLCTPGSEGQYQFGLVVSQISVPTFDSGNALAGISGSTGFVIFDPTCVPVAAYGTDDSGNDCGVPYEMDYFPSKPLVVGGINWDVSAPWFAFDFGGKHYNAHGKECGGCNTYYTDGGLRPVSQCKCGFDVGTCTLPNIQDAPMEYAETKDALCTPQASGNYQLSLDTRFSTLGLYDSECHSVATYRVGKDELADGCALPMKIDYFGGEKVITVRKLATDVFVPGWNKDEAAFTFEFGARSYGSRDDWCSGCKGQGSDDELNQGCKCGFYVG